ncbi:MAG: DinB family protein [Vicinamibacterales bacterium]
MAIVDALLPELDHEIAVTRKLLERVPDDRSDWKPHIKSYSLGQLATHVANLPHWGVITISQAELDMDGAGVAAVAASRAALLAAFDEKSTAFRAALTGRTDAELMVPWTLKQSGKIIFSMPKAAVLRSFVMNHLIHHRGQLSVYLRQLDVPLPSIYGPSADENPF